MPKPKPFSVNIVRRVNFIIFLSLKSFRRMKTANDKENKLYFILTLFIPITEKKLIKIKQKLVNAYIYIISTHINKHANSLTGGVEL